MAILGLKDEEILKLHEVKPKAVLFTSTDIHDFKQGALTSTDPTAINLTSEDLQKLCHTRYEEFKNTYNQNNYSKLT